jgi:hypothetical protein
MNNRKLSQAKSRFLVLILTVLVLLFAVSLVLNKKTTLKEDDTVLTINGEPVSVAEFLNIRSGLRANVYSYFSQKNGTGENKNFWKTSFEGEVPGEILNKQTIEVLKKIKTEQILMKNNGITKDISYSGFLEYLNAENERRKVAIIKNIPVYGPVHYDEKIFYDYLHSQREEKLKQILHGKVFILSQEEIILYYNENKNGKYMVPDYKRIGIITLSSTSSYKNISANKNDKFESVINQIMKRIRSGEKLETVVNEMKKRGTKGIEFKEHVLNGSAARNDSIISPAVSAKIKDLEINQIGQVIEGDKKLMIVKIIEKAPVYFMTFEEVKGQIEKELIDKKYENLINSLLDSVKVEINGKILGKISG